MLISESRFRNYFWVILYPLACFWAVVVTLRRKLWPDRSRFRAAIPVVCVGNLHCGGSGKTPLVVALASALQSYNPVVLSRGYRSRVKTSPVRVNKLDPAGCEQFGDEPLMMAEKLDCPIYVGPDRARVLSIAQSQGQHRLAILDDGFQHLQVAASTNLIAIAANRSPNDSYCLPFGEMREPFGSLKYADAVILMTSLGLPEYAEVWKHFLQERYPEMPFFVAERRWDGVFARQGTKQELGSGVRLAAFCGIAGPGRFFEDVERWIAKPVVKRTYRDHHRYTDADIKDLIEWKLSSGATHFITTEKDWVRIMSGPSALDDLLVAQIHYELPENFWYFLKSRLELG